MKKVISSLLVLSMVLFTTVAKADNLTAEQAKAIGAHYMAYQTGVDKITPAALTLIYQYENPDMEAVSAYVFNVASCGWVIVAGSSVVEPIIAFSDEGSLDMDNIPDNMRWWMEGYTGAIAEVQLLDAENDYPDNEEYIKLLKQGVKNGTKEERIVLMSTQWAQGANTNPTYNYFCPVWNNRYCVTGCVATALSQICKYYEYPVRPKKGVVSTVFHGEYLKINLDTVSFNYSKMPKKLKSSTPLDTVKEVAMLSYSLGVTVQMDYDPDGSAASSETAKNQMKIKFKYQQGTFRQRNGTTDTNYVNTIRRNLMAGDVIYMHGASSTGSGADASGHAWVADGYMREDTKKYHMNWGWAGSGDGFFNLADNSMRPTGTGYNFNVSQGVILNMLPPEDSNIHHKHVAIREVDNATVLGTAYPNPATMSVTLPYTTETVSDLQVFGIDGKLVATRRVQPGCGEVTLRVDALPKGIYIYRMNGQSGKFIVR